MTDPITALAERLRTQYGVCRQADTLGTPDPYEVFWQNVAREALVCAREQVPTREEIVRSLIAEFGLDCHVCDPKWYGPIASTLLRDLRRRLGGK